VARATTLTPAYLVTLTNSNLSMNANITVEYEVDSPQSRTAAHVSFIPSAFGVASGASVPTGAEVGSIAIAQSESVSNGPCASATSLLYDLFDASTNTGDTVADTPKVPSASWPGFSDANANGLVDAIDKYPAFLNVLYPGVTPRARSYGSIPSSLGTINRVVNVLVLEPGTNLPGVGILPVGLGYPVVVVQQDPTPPAASSVISEACSYAKVTRQDRGLTANNPDTGVNEGGFVYRTNPSVDGSYTFLDYGRSIRDFDSDGIENTLDSCPTVSTPIWNPRISDPTNDFDSDGIPGKDDPFVSGEQLQAGSGCDPTPLTANSDADADGFLNRQDNCPIVANGAAGNNQADPDGDGIGSSCDVLDNLGDGHLHEVCVSENETIGSGGTPTAPTCPQYVLDQDNDGFTKTAEDHVFTPAANTDHDPCGGNGFPLELNSTGGSANDIDISDLASFVAPVRHIDTDPGDPGYNVRWDLIPFSAFGKDINIQDLAIVVTSYPPMFEGAKAYNGPPCPYAP